MIGILTGCDKAQEWLLPWWFEQVREHHPELPIAFGDLGMSEEGKEWCEARGILIPASQIPPLTLSYSSQMGWPYNGERWRADNISLNPERPQRIAGLRKPLLMEQSPFERTLWLDLDCQVLKNLSSLLSLSLPETKLAIRSCGHHYSMKAIGKLLTLLVPNHNSGVVLFEKGSSLLRFWSNLVKEANRNFENDDQILSFAVHCHQIPIGKINNLYNWKYREGPNPEIAIFHWLGKQAKSVLELRLRTSQ